LSENHSFFWKYEDLSPKNGQRVMKMKHVSVFLSQNPDYLWLKTENPLREERV
jgi:hypothetical protein